MSKIEIEETELNELKARLAKLERAAEPVAPIKSEPHRPIDYAARASMDAETMRDMARVFPDSLVRDLHADARKPNPVTQSQALLSQGRGSGRVEIRGSGWAAPNPITPPPGVALCDRLLDMQDAIDKADLQRRLGGAKKE